MLTSGATAVVSAKEADKQEKPEDLGDAPWSRVFFWGLEENTFSNIKMSFVVKPLCFLHILTLEIVYIYIYRYIYIYIPSCVCFTSEVSDVQDKIKAAQATLKEARSFFAQAALAAKEAKLAAGTVQPKRAAKAKAAKSKWEGFTDHPCRGDCKFIFVSLCV